MNIRQAVVFAILMGTDQRILGKHPSYLLEKLKACESFDVPEMLLDSFKKAVFDAYAREFGLGWNTEADLKVISKESYEVDSITGRIIERGHKK